MHEFDQDESLTLIGSRPLNHSKKTGITYRVQDSDFYFFVLKSEDSTEVRIFKKREYEEAEVDEALDVLLVCNQVPTEQFLDEFGEYAESVIFNLNLFAGV